MSIFSKTQMNSFYKEEVDKQRGKTRSSFYSNLKNEIRRIVQPGGIVVCCGWNSQGLGINRGFEMVEVLLVPHGGAHNDTIVTVERKRGNYGQ